jgi:hypothetical protein
LGPRTSRLHDSGLPGCFVGNETRGRNRKAPVHSRRSLSWTPGVLSPLWRSGSGLPHNEPGQQTVACIVRNSLAEGRLPCPTDGHPPVVSDRRPANTRVAVPAMPATVPASVARAQILDLLNSELELHLLGVRIDRSGACRRWQREHRNAGGEECGL